MLSLRLRGIITLTIAVGIATAATAAGADVPATPAPIASPADAASPEPTLAPGSALAPDGPGLRRFLDAAPGGFTSLTTSPEARPTGSTWTTYDVPNLTDTRSCSVVVDDSPSVGTQLACRVENGDDLLVSDEAYDALVSEFTKLTHVTGTVATTRSRFLFTRTTAFALPSGVSVSVVTRTRVDPHIRMIEFEITAPPQKH